MFDYYGGLYIHVQILSKIGAFEPDGFAIVMIAPTATVTITSTAATNGHDG